MSHWRSNDSVTVRRPTKRFLRPCWRTAQSRCDSPAVGSIGQPHAAIMRRLGWSVDLTQRSGRFINKRLPPDGHLPWTHAYDRPQHSSSAWCAWRPTSGCCSCDSIDDRRPPSTRPSLGGASSQLSSGQSSLARFPNRVIIDLPQTTAPEYRATPRSGSSSNRRDEEQHVYDKRKYDARLQAMDTSGRVELYVHITRVRIRNAHALLRLLPRVRRTFMETPCGTVCGLKRWQLSWSQFMPDKSDGVRCQAIVPYLHRLLSHGGPSEDDVMAGHWNLKRQSCHCETVCRGSARHS